MQTRPFTQLHVERLGNERALSAPRSAVTATAGLHAPPPESSPLYPRPRLRSMLALHPTSHLWGEQQA